MGAGPPDAGAPTLRSAPAPKYAGHQCSVSDGGADEGNAPEQEEDGECGERERHADDDGACARPRRASGDEDGRDAHAEADGSDEDATAENCCDGEARQDYARDAERQCGRNTC